jgi:hypothetical protein
VVALLVVRGSRELLDAHVPRVEWGDQALDGAALAGGVPALEQHAQRRAEPVADQAAEHEPQREQPALRRVQPLGLLLLAQPQRQVELVQRAHGGNLQSLTS